MALRGSLTDLNVVELVQIPAAGHKTGELFIAGLDGIARLYYDAGRLVHLETDDLRGQEVLVEIVSWAEGEFEFRPDIAAEEATFETDLHRALMAALKTRDELLAAQHVRGGSDGRTPADDTELAEKIRDFVGSNGHLQCVCLLRADGSVIRGDREGGQEPPWMERLRGALGMMLEAYPRRGLQRVLFEDDEGTVVMSRLGDGTALVAVADAEATLGAVSVAVERFARKLDGE